MTLDDLKNHFTLCFKIDAFSELTTKIWMKIDITISGKYVAQWL